VADPDLEPRLTYQPSFLSSFSFVFFYPKYRWGRGKGRGQVSQTPSLDLSLAAVA